MIRKPAILLLVASFFLTGISAGGLLMREGPVRPMPASVRPHLRGDYMLNADFAHAPTYGPVLVESGVPISVSLSIGLGNAASVRMKAFFQPGDITITSDTLQPDGHTVASTSSPIDPVTLAFTKYQTDHPDARLLATPDNAWLETHFDLFDIPIKALVLPNANTGNSRIELDCSALPIPDLASSGRHIIHVQLNRSAASSPASGGLPPGNGLYGKSEIQIAGAAEIKRLQLSMAVPRIQAEQLLKAQAQFELHTDSFETLVAPHIEYSADALLHYRASYVAGRQTVDLQLFARQSPVTLSVNGNPAQWPAGITKPESPPQP